MEQVGVNYYFLKDLHLVAKIDNDAPYIYHNGWKTDKHHLFMDRLMGYDGEKMGVTDMLERCKHISEEEAMVLISEK